MPKQCVNGNAMKRRPTDRGWSAKLSRTIVLKNGTTLATLADARSFILREPAPLQERQSWHRGAELMIQAAEHGGSIEAATTQIELALFLEALFACPYLVFEGILCPSSARASRILPL